MPEEHDSWFKAAFGVDLAEAASKVKDEALATIDKVKSAVAQGHAAGASTAGGGEFPLGGSVGRGGKNAASDVRAVQRALGIAADGDCGPQTVDAIKAYQRKMGSAKPDGRVDPGGMTERALAGGGQPRVAATNDERDYGSRVKLVDIAVSGQPTSDDGATAVEGDLVDALLQQQTALLQSLANAGSEAEREHIQEELEGVGAEISSELWALKATEAIDEATRRQARADSDVQGNGEEEAQSDLLGEVIEGDFHEGESTWTGTAANVAVGVVPIVGQVADVRDTAAAVKDVWNDPSWGNVANLGLAAAGWVPLVGDAAKGAVKVGRKATQETGEELLQEGAQAADDLAGEAAQQLEGEARHFENLSDKEFDAGFDELESGTLLELPGHNRKTGEGLTDIKIRADESQPIAHQDKMVFKGIEGAPHKKVEVRRHSKNPTAPDGSYSKEHPTTQINSKDKYRLPDGTYKRYEDMTEAEKAAAHMK